MLQFLYKIIHFRSCWCCMLRIPNFQWFSYWISNMLNIVPQYTVCSDLSLPLLYLRPQPRPRPFTFIFSFTFIYFQWSDLVVGGVEVDYIIHLWDRKWYCHNYMCVYSKRYSVSILEMGIKSKTENGSIYLFGWWEIPKIHLNGGYWVLSRRTFREITREKRRFMKEMRDRSFQIGGRMTTMTLVTRATLRA